MKYRMVRKKKGLMDLFAEEIYGHLERFFNINRTNDLIRSIKTVSKQEAEKLCHEYYILVIKRLMAVVVITLLFAGIVIIKSNKNSDKVILDRGSYGEDTKECRLSANIDNTEYDFCVDVLPLEYKYEDMDAVFEKGFAYIDKIYLGNNSEKENIVDDLNLIDSIDELGVEVRWTSDNDEIMDTRGKLADTVLESPVNVELEAALCYKDYTKKKKYNLIVKGKKRNTYEIVIEEIKKYITTFQQENNDMQRLELPKEINGYTISKPEPSSPVMLIIIIGGVVSFLILYKSNKDLKAENVYRNRQLIKNYPEFADKLSLYMGAGLSVRGALYKISEELGKEKKQKNRYGNRYDNILGDEIKYTLNEISSGISEEQAYFNLGHRLNLSVYLKLTSLLSQNVKKGTKNVLDMLAQEEEAAIQLRRELAKKRGEEAGTKLLFPMIVLLAVVMVIVVLPALISF